MFKRAILEIKLISCLLTLGLGILVSYQSSASTAIPSQNIHQHTTINKHETDNRDKRLKKLDSIESSLNSFNSIIPNPTPEERKWVETEQNEIDKITDSSMSRNREGQLVTSIPYTEQRAKKLIKEALAWVKKIKDTTNTNDEIIYWTQLAIVITDSYALTSVLDALQSKIPEKTIRPYYLDAALLEMDGRAILSHTIIPYLEKNSFH